MHPLVKYATLAALLVGIAMLARKVYDSHANDAEKVGIVVLVVASAAVAMMGTTKGDAIAFRTRSRA